MNKRAIGMVLGAIAIVIMAAAGALLLRSVQVHQFGQFTSSCSSPLVFLANGAPRPPHGMPGGCYHETWRRTAIAAVLTLVSIGCTIVALRQTRRRSSRQDM